jgi:hypothetical protein
MKKSSSQKNILPAVFEEKEVRRVWDEIFEKWFFFCCGYYSYFESK